MSPRQVREVTQGLGEAADEKQNWLIAGTSKLANLVLIGANSDKHR